jgi:TolB protein
VFIQQTGDRPEVLKLANADGTGKRVVLRDFGSISDPAWSPDGRWIAFWRLALHPNALGDIYLIRPDGTDLHLVGPGTNLSWSPDGNRPLFIKNPPDAEGFRYQQIFVMNPDGSGVTQLTDHRTNFAPTWSPDGDRIAFVHDTGARAEPRLWTMAPDGSDAAALTVLTRAAGLDWAPDGSSILVSGFFYIDEPEDGCDQYFGTFKLLDPDDGSLIREFGEIPGTVMEPRWSPDGLRIVYTAPFDHDQHSRCGGDVDLPDRVGVINADGTGNHVLLDPPSPTFFGDAVWGPRRHA